MLTGHVVERTFRAAGSYSLHVLLLPQPPFTGSVFCIVTSLDAETHPFCVTSVCAVCVPLLEFFLLGDKHQ